MAWRTSLASGERERVFRECVHSILTRPRTHETRQALLVLDELEAPFPIFREVNVAGTWSGDYALDLFYFRAFGAAKAGDRDRYFSALRAATGIDATSHDRDADVRQLLVDFGFPPPVVARFVNDPGSQLTLTYRKDAPGVDYRCDETDHLPAGPGTLIEAPETPNPDGTWSFMLPAAEARTRFVRLRATIQ